MWCILHKQKHRAECKSIYKTATVSQGPDARHTKRLMTAHRFRDWWFSSPPYRSPSPSATVLRSLSTCRRPILPPYIIIIYIYKPSSIIYIYMSDIMLIHHSEFSLFHFQYDASFISLFIYVCSRRLWRPSLSPYAYTVKILTRIWWIVFWMRWRTGTAWIDRLPTTGVARVNMAGRRDLTNNDPATHPPKSANYRQHEVI